MVSKGCKGTEAIHSSSSKHSSHKHDPNLSEDVKDVLISPHSPCLLNPARQLPRQCLSCRWGARPWGAPEPELQLHPPVPSVAKELPRSCSSAQAAQPAAGKRLGGEGDSLGSSHLATLTLQERCTHPPSLCMPTAPGSKNSFPSIARNLQPSAFKMNGQAFVTGSKKYVPGQTQPAGAKQGVGDGSTPVLEAMNSLTPSSNSTVTCISPKEKNPSRGYS